MHTNGCGKNGAQVDGHDFLFCRWATHDRTCVPRRAPDLELDPYHPRRTFMRRALDLEVRLGYYDRILKTLPEGMQVPEALVMPAEAPGYEFEYESESTFKVDVDRASVRF